MNALVTSHADIPEFLEQLRHERFYGSLEIKLEAGRVVLLRKTETIKPTESNTAVNTLSRQSRGHHGYSEH